MYSGIFFILFTILAIAFAPQQGGWPSSFGNALSISFLAYLLILGVIYYRKKKRKRGVFPYAALLLFILFFHYVVVFQRFLPFYLEVLISLSLYFIGLAIATKWQTVLFYLPFVLPFLIYFLGMEFLTPLIGESRSSYIVFALIFSSFLFFSLFFQWIWQCKPLPPSTLKEKIDQICRQHHFRHGGIKIWKFSNLGATAGIIGVIPRFRYILLTEPLLKNLSDDEIVSIFAHEMGHSVHHHLFIYPFLIFGIPLINSLFYSFLEPLPAFLFFVIEIVWIYVYIRFIFGFFSRHFEREADYFVFSLHLNPVDLIEALKKICYLNRIDIELPNWHHGSIQSRIDAMWSAIENPSVIKKHYRRLRLILFIYAGLIGFLSVYLFIFGGIHAIA